MHAYDLLRLIESCTEPDTQIDAYEASYTYNRNRLGLSIANSLAELDAAHVGHAGAIGYKNDTQSDILLAIAYGDALPTAADGLYLTKYLLAAGGMRWMPKMPTCFTLALALAATSNTVAAGVSAVRAYGTLTSDLSNPSAGDTVTIGNRTFTFVSAFSSEPTVADEIMIGVDADTTLGNLKAGINGTGTAGIEYSEGTVAHTQVTCGNVTAHAVTITAKLYGTAGNAYASTETGSHLSWGAATLGGGVRATETITFAGAANTMYFLNISTVEQVAMAVNANVGFIHNTHAAAGKPIGTRGIGLQTNNGFAGNVVITITYPDSLTAHSTANAPAVAVVRVMSDPGLGDLKILFVGD